MKIENLSITDRRILAVKFRTLGWERAKHKNGLRWNNGNRFNVRRIEFDSYEIFSDSVGFFKFGGSTIFIYKDSISIN